MGTSQSHCPARKHRRDRNAASDSHTQGKSIPKGKPTPPSQPVVTDVTHNSVTLSWQPPRRHSGGKVYAYTVEMSTTADPKNWRVLSKCCQGNSYQAKNLEPGSQYLFRVRAENIHGMSKPSRTSEVAETKLFGVDQQGFVPAPEDRARPAPRHQPSISLHLEGTVTSLLNHTDIHVMANAREARGIGGMYEEVEEDGSSPKSERRSLNGQADYIDGQGRRGKSSCLQRDGTARSSLQSDRFRSNSLQREVVCRSSLQSDRWKSSSLQREANQRSSLQPTRKRSLPILLPGTRTDSLNKLRDSQTFPVTSKSRLNDAIDSGRRRGGPNGRDRLARDIDGFCSGSREEMVNGKTENGTGDVKPSKRDSGLEEDSENPWERDDSASEVSDGVTAAIDDRKAELLSLSLPDTPGWLGVNSGTEADFRMLRRVLHSDDIIVKPTHSLPDMGSWKISPHNTLSTILDLGEEDDSVRITTL